MPIDRAAARAFLQERFADVGELRPIRAGAWSTPYFFEARVDGVRRELVARFGPHGDDFAKDALASSWSSAALPAPQVLLVERVGEQFAVVSQRRPGVFLEDLDRSGWSAALPRVFDAIDELRRVPVTSGPPECVLGPGAPPPPDCDSLGLDVRWVDWLTDLTDDPSARVGGWSRTLAASPTGDRSLREGLELLRELAADLDPPRSFVHSDLLNRNVTVAPDGSRLHAIFDWGCLFLGDYLYDVAWLDFWAPWHDGLATLDVPRAAREHFAASDPSIEDFDRRVRVCAIHIGLCHLAYNAFVGDPGQVAACDRRLAGYDARAPRDPG